MMRHRFSLLRDEPDFSRTARKRAKKAEEAERRYIARAGISGAGLWRKARACGRVRGH